MNNYSDEILQELRQALINDSSFSFRQAGDNLRQGICPNCGERECFVDLKQPWRVSCGRLNNCKWSETTRNLYPHIFENLSKRHPATEQNPNATADAYMTEVRGFDPEIIKGMYSQVYAKNKSKEEYYPAVKVIISQQCYWLRLINADDVRKNEAKSKIVGDFRGYGWIPPNMQFKDGDEIWITEGIFKSMAFLHIGMKSIAGLSASNLPLDIIKANAGRKIIWVLAEDNDPAGISAAEKFAAIIRNQGEECRIAFAHAGEDWDDVYRDGRLNREYLQESFFRGLYNLADTYQRKAFFHYCRYKLSHSVIDFQFALYKYQKNDKKFADHEEENNFKYPHPEKSWNAAPEYIDRCFALFNSFVEIKEICPCKPEFLYIEKDIVTQERTNCFYIEFANHTPSMLFSTDGTIYKNADNFSTGLLRYTGFAPFNGNSGDLNILHKRWFHQRIKFVQSVPFAGYEPETKIYVFPDFAYCNGVYQKVNKHGFFTFNRHSIKCTLSGLRFRADSDELNGDWIRAFYQAFDLNGMVLLAWWTGTLFAQQIRAKQDSWPFLEYTGDPGAGKSTQLRFMWRCLGVDGYEGFDPNKTTPAGRSRQMTQGSNLPTVLLEADRHDGGRKNL
ncbi:MAG: toprim domain-containing protein, partial [Victivallales bacterium]|nr:toprim domain-containing protein [Victivallales bacterium]